MHVRCLWLAAALTCIGVSARAQESSSSATPPTPAPPADAQAPAESTADQAPAAVIGEAWQSDAPSSTSDATTQSSAGSSSESLIVDTGMIIDPEIDTPASLDERTRPSMEFVPTGDVRVALQSRAGVDFRWKSVREDVAEATQIMLLETRLRRSESLRFVAGLRARHQIATRREATSDGDAVRHSLDVAPTAAYADVTVADGVHVRAGYQVTRVGRFDLFSATNMLAVADLRSGPVSMPDAVDVAQPAVRLDWDATPWLSVQAIHVPFFQPHIVDLVEGDYAMFRTTQAQVDAALDSFADDDNDPTTPPIDCDNSANAASPPCVARSRVRDLYKQMTRSGRSGLGAGAFGAFSDGASLANPQGSLRATAHSSLGELSLTIGTALEHLPSLFVDKALQDAMRPNIDDFQRQQRLAQVTRAFDIAHNRYAVLALDGALPLGPLQLGFETAYMFNRTLYSAQTVCSGPGNECNFYAPTPEQSDMLHGALRVELAQDETLVIGMEAFATYALDDPNKADNHAWLTLMDGRYMTGAALLSRWAPAETGLTFELSSVLLAGPTFMITPRVQWQALETLFVEVGAIWVEGAKIPSIVENNGPMGRDTMRADWAVGGLYRNTDQVFAGLRWTP